MAKAAILDEGTLNFIRGMKMFECACLQLRTHFKKWWDEKNPKALWNDDTQSGENLYSGYHPPGKKSYIGVYDDKIRSGQRDQWDMTILNRVYFEYTFMDTVDKTFKEEVRKIKNVRNSYCHPKGGYATRPKDTFQDDCETFREVFQNLKLDKDLLDEAMNINTTDLQALLTELLKHLGELFKEVRSNTLGEAEKNMLARLTDVEENTITRLGEVEANMITRLGEVENIKQCMKAQIQRVSQELNSVLKTQMEKLEYGISQLTLQDSGLPRDELETAQHIFVQTDAFNVICEALDYYGHVLISGSLGWGKTTMSLIIMGRYRQQNYQVAFLDDVSKFNPEQYADVQVPTLIVFDDVFGHVSLTTKELVHCRRVFKFLNTRLNRLHCDVSDIPLKVVMNCRTNVLHMTLPKLPEYKNSFLKDGATVNLTTLGPLHETTKRKILTKHLKRAKKCLEPEVVTKIAQQNYSTLGFPYLCKLFADNFFAVADPVEFFENPLTHLTSEIKKIFSMDEMKDRASVLLLMLLNDGMLNLVHLQSSEQRQESGLEKLLLRCKEILGNLPSPWEIGRAARNENHTYIKSEGDVMRFSHPAIHDAVALVIADGNQLFVVENCSLQFLLERTVVEEEGATGSPSESNFTDFKIHLKNESAKKLINRLAKEIVECRFALPLSHKCFSQESAIELLFKDLSSLDNMKTCLHSHDAEYGLGFLFWSSFLCTGPLCRKSFEHTSFSQEQIGEGWFGCCLSGNEAPLQALKDHTEANISNMTLGNILKLATDTRPVYQRLHALQSPDKPDMIPEKETPRVHGDNSDMLIHIASANGFKNVVEALLEMGADINARGGNKMTALMYVCYLGHIDLVKYLLTEKADPSLLDEEGDNCLHLACRSGNTEIVKVLHEKGMDLNTRGEHDRTPLMYASYHGHENVLRFLLDKGAKPDLDSSLVENKDTCLHLACIKGHKNIVRILLVTGAVDIEGQGMLGRTALMYACRHGQLETAKELVSWHAKADVVDELGFTCLHLTAIKGHIPTAKWLFKLQKDLSVDCQNQIGRTPLMMALKNGQSVMVVFLLDKGSDINIIDNGGYSCLHFAVTSGILTLVKQCTAADLDINHTTKTGLTPMMLACNNGNIELLKHLVEKGGDVRKGFPGNCLHSAAFGGHVEIVKYLVSLSQLDINKTGLKNRTPFMCACFKGFTEIAEYLKNKGAHVDCRDEYGQTSLHYACFTGCLGLVTFLLSLQSFDIDCGDNEDNTPLSFAIRSDKPDVIELLVKKGADLKKTDPQKRTYLHTAALTGKVNSCRKLLKLGIDSKALDKDNKTALMLAQDMDDHTEVTEALKSDVRVKKGFCSLQ